MTIRNQPLKNDRLRVDMTTVPSQEEIPIQALSSGQHLVVVSNDMLAAVKDSIVSTPPN